MKTFIPYFMKNSLESIYLPQESFSYDRAWSEIPLNQEHQMVISQFRQTINKILNGEDSRLLLIVGPCSIHHPEKAIEYAQKLFALRERAKERFFIIMRTYVEKARSSLGWRGMLLDPHLDESYDIFTGITRTRSLLMDLTEMGMPCASELLDCNNAGFYSDFLSWGCIGARTSSSPPHRLLASSLPFAVGFKNSTEGDLHNPINGITCAQKAHTFLGIGANGKLQKISTKGNMHTHLVLRGSHQTENFSEEKIAHATLLLKDAHLSTGLLIDCAHGNSNKDPLKQIEVFQKIIETKNQTDLPIRGLMLESYLKAGNQTHTSSIDPNLSLTDACLDWESTEKLIEKYL